MIVKNLGLVPPMERYEINALTGCWLWVGYVNADGYARLGSENAHRTFYRELVGTIEEGHDIDHLCKRRSCVNPEHLESVPEIENIRREAVRVIYKGRGVNTCRKGHVMEGENLKIYVSSTRGSKRVCNACRIESSSRNSKAKADAAGREYRPYKQKLVTA